VPRKHFLTDASPLVGSDAAAAVIVTEDGRYLLQQRDDKAGIWYPGHWGCFGGAVSRGETALRTLKRELAEELEFRPRALAEFIRFDFDLRRLGGTKVYRAYYEVTVPAAAVRRFVLHEGAAMRLFSPAQIFRRADITPYDSFALWLHYARRRLARPAGGRARHAKVARRRKGF
jgi:8-oxo-dGTP pyrophosphatase MutT (NUDIX family)